MGADLKAHSKTGIISLILCLVSVGLIILIKAIAPNYDIAFFLYFR